MSIALDSSVEFSGTGSNIYFANLTCTDTDQDGYLLAAVSSQSGTDYSAWAVNYDSIPLTLISVLTGTLIDTSFWGLKNPPSGTAFYAIGTGGPNESVYSCAASFTGVDEEASIEASNTGTGNGTAISTSITTLTDNALIVDFASGATQGADPTKDASQALIQSGQSGGNFPTGSGMSYKLKASAGSESMLWTLNGTGDWTHHLVALRAAGGRMKMIGVDKIIFS